MHRSYYYFMIPSKVQDSFGGKTNHTFRGQHLPLPACIGAEETMFVIYEVVYQN